MTTITIQADPDYIDDRASAVVQTAIATFENISRNAYSWPATDSYDVNGNLSTTVYTTPDGTITKTRNYNSNGLVETVVLSGDVPAGVPTTKTIAYTNGRKTGQSYS